MKDGLLFGTDGTGAHGRAAALVRPESDKIREHNAVIAAVEDGSIGGGGGGGGRGPGDGEGGDREWESERIRSLLDAYVDAVGVGNEFQAVDFTNYLVRKDLMPDESVLDARCIGGMFVALRKSGRVSVTRYAPNGGCAQRKYNSTVRPVYRVDRRAS